MEDFLFIEHFAVEATYRGEGLGGRLLQSLCAMKNKPICLEVELPETPIAARRIRFYERNGFFYTDYPYIQPAISKGRLPLPLRIMSYPRKVSEGEFLKMKSRIYKEVYGATKNV